MSVVALHLYEKLNDAVDEKARSKAIESGNVMNTKTYAFN